MEKVLFIVNPISGGKDKNRIIALIDKLIDKARFGYEIIKTTRRGQATEIARDCDADIVVAVGGDGTVSEVAQGLVGSGKALGIIPCGSGDGLALHLGISRNPKKAILQLNKATVTSMDHGIVNGRPFFCTTGVGFDAIVGRDFASSKSRGLWTYITTAMKDWLNFEPESYTVEVDGQKWAGRAAMITVGNVNQWGNQARITPLASVTDGLFDVTIVEPFRTWEIPGLALKLLTGQAHKSRRTVCLRGAEVMIHRESAGAMHYDGDPCEEGKEIKITMVPAALRVAAPDNKKI